MEGSVGTTKHKKIDQQSVLQTAEKENTHHIPITLTLHPHKHIVKSFILKTLNYSKTIQRLVQSFHNLHKYFWLEVHFKPMTNLELSNAHTHNAKLVLSFLT